MSAAADTTLVAVLSVPAVPWWQGSFAAGLVGALVGGVLALVGAAVSPFFTHWWTVRVTSQRVAGRVRRDLRAMQLTIGSVVARLTPENGMLDQFGPAMLNDLADRLAAQLVTFRERDGAVVDLRDEDVERRVLKVVDQAASFERLLRRWTAPIPNPGDDIRITDYSQERAEGVRRRCDAEWGNLEGAIKAVAKVERWRWRLPRADPPRS